jgi:WD40 repeat protein
MEPRLPDSGGRLRRSTCLLLSFSLLAGLGPAGWAQPAARPVDADARVLPAASGELFAVAFSPDSRIVAAGGGDSAVGLWDARTGQLLGTLRGHAGPVRALVFTRDGKWLVSGSDDRTVRVWDAATHAHGRTIGGHFGAVTALALSPDQQLLASGSQNGSLRILEFASGREVRAVKRGFATLHAAAFAGDRRTLVTGSSDGRISLWDVASGQERGLTGHTGAVRGVALSPVEPLAASASADQTIRLWDLRSGREVAALAGHTGEVTALAFSPNGLLLASGGRDGTLRVWDVKGRRERLARTDQGGAIWALAFSPDGSMLATAGHDRQVRLRSPAALLAAPSAGEALLDVIREGSTEPGPGPPASPPLAVVALTVSPTPAVTGSDVIVTIKVTNRGKGPLYRFSARTASPETALDNLEFFFGKIEGDDFSTIAQPVRLSRELPDSELPVRVEFREDHGFAPAPIEARIFVKGEVRPRFAYRYQVLDDGSGGSPGNGDGRLSRGEAFDLLVTVKNTGLAEARQGWLDVWSRSMRGLRIRGGSVDLGTLAPDETRSARVHVEVAADFPTDQLLLMLGLRETGVNARLTDELKLPIDAAPGPKPTSASRTVAVAAPGLLVHAGAGADTPVIAAAPGGHHLPVTAEAGAWYRVRVGPHDHGWVPRAAVTDRGTAPPVGPPPALHLVFQHAPPLVVLTSPTEGLRTGAALVELGGVAASTRGISRVDVAVNGRRAPDGPPAAAAGPAGLRELVQKIPLDGGANDIEVTVVDGSNQAVRHTRRVFRTTQ